MSDVLKAFEAAKKLEAGLLVMRTELTTGVEEDQGEAMVREAFDILGALLDPQCDQWVKGGVDYSVLPWDYREQHEKNQKNPETRYERSPFGVTNVGFNLDSGYKYLYESRFQCYLRHGHSGPCRPATKDIESLRAPTKEEENDG